ncbi:MAG: nuclear transport factor 2 family protein [Fibrobacteria bacterium]
MPAPTQPEALHAALAAAFNARDLEGLLSLYDANAALVPQPGTVAVGEKARRDALAGFLSLSPRETFVDTLGVLRAGDLALTYSHWGLKGTASDGAPLALDHYGIEIMRLQKDRTWRFLVDDPFGGDDVIVREEATWPASGNEAPSALHQRMARLFNEGSIDGLVALYTDEATLVPEPGKAVSGKAALRAALSGFLALRPSDSRFTTVGVVRAGDVALTRSHWSMLGSSPQGDLKLDHHGLEVMRRDANGAWRFVIDDPFAGDAAVARPASNPK